MLGKKSLTTETSPKVGQAVLDSDVAYINRPGGHSVEVEDWILFLGFAEKHWKRP